jgi:hypothetical protein
VKTARFAPRGPASLGHAARFALAASALGAAALFESAAVAAETPALPEVVTPAPLELGRAPDGLVWSYESEGLRVVGGDGLPIEQSALARPTRKASPARPNARGRKAPSPRADTGTTWVRVEGSTAPALVAFAWQAPRSTYANGLAVACRPWLEGPVRWPLRWETLRGDEAGAPLWQVNDGWYDEQSCQVSVEHRTTLRPAVLAQQGSRPTVLAAREGDTVTFLLAPTRSLLTHDLAGSLRTTQGPFTRVSVPVGPGQAATIVASFLPHSLASWWRRPGAIASPLVNLNPPEPNLLEVRVDLSQAVAEEEPTLAIKRTTDDPNDPSFGGPSLDSRSELHPFLKLRHKR